MTKGRIVKCVNGGECLTIPDLKTKTKVGSGCGGCMPLVCIIIQFPSKSSANDPPFRLLLLPIPGPLGYEHLQCGNEEGRTRPEQQLVPSLRHEPD